MKSALRLLAWLPLLALIVIGVQLGRFTGRGGESSTPSAAAPKAGEVCREALPAVKSQNRVQGGVRPESERSPSVKIQTEASLAVASRPAVDPMLESMLKALRASALKHPLRKRGKAPLLERIARVTWEPENAPEAVEQGCKSYPGDVFISGIPMIDQGDKAYCAVASAARVLQGYGIEVTMEDMAELANSSATGGTSLSSWDAALRKVAGEHGLELKAVAEMFQDNADNERIFNQNVLARVDDSDPLFWTVTLGEVPEEMPEAGGELVSLRSGTHMRLIIGYNDERGEVLYSDSWGEGHELKRMDAQDALSITHGLFYLTD